MRKLLALAVFVGLSWTGSAIAAEALLIRHDVLTVPMGAEVELKTGFFIGKAWTADGWVAETAVERDQRTVVFKAKNPGRTVVTAWNLREPHKRIEFEIMVTDDSVQAALTPSLLPGEADNAYEPPKFDGEHRESVMHDPPDVEQDVPDFDPTN